MRVDLGQDGKIARRILTGMIVDTAVLGRIAPRWSKGHYREGYFDNQKFNIIAKFCVDYFSRYHTAPGENIVGIFEEWAETEKPEEDSFRATEAFLSSLSGEYERLREESNSAHIIDLAGKFFTGQIIGRLASDLALSVKNNRVSKAEEAIAAYRRVDLGSGSRVDPLRDESVINSCFSEDNSDILIEYPGDMGKFFQDSLSRDCFVSVMASEKTGKSFQLFDFAWRAMLQRRRVAFFSAGDMSEKQILRRLYCRAAKHPFRSPDGKWPLMVEWPTAIQKPKDGEDHATVTADLLRFDGPLSAEIARKACKRVMIKEVKSNESYLALDCYGNGTLTVDMIGSRLEEWSRDGFTADVVVCDYADILGFPKGYRPSERRDAINENWSQLRMLSTRYHCLVITATQADAGSYTQRTLTKANFSDDKRKYSHVTGCMGISMTGQEKEAGVCRWNWLQAREMDFSWVRCLHVARCLPLASPAVLATF